MQIKNSTILITGGTGSLGKQLTETLLEKHQLKKLIIFSRDELKQYEMSMQFPESRYPQLRFFIGDVRDQDRLKRAFENVDIVIHAAALKQVPAAEYNPMEFVKTNVIGAENVVSAALDAGVKSVVALSTDKAAAPINLYGATKLCSDKLFVAANNIKGDKDIRFSAVRYGNVMGSRGSVIPFFLSKRKTGVLPVTHEDMTRFNILIQEGVDLVIYAIENAWGGEIFVPKIPSFKILDLAKAVAPECKIEVVGMRPGEKIHEEMITESDSLLTMDIGKYYAILPHGHSWNKADYVKTFKAKPVPLGFRLSSGTNANWLSVEQLRDLIREHFDAGL
jgi:UDP-N-acetylglucosamine 4,6-dehydratase